VNEPFFHNLLAYSDIVMVRGISNRQGNICAGLICTSSR